MYLSVALSLYSFPSFFFLYLSVFLCTLSLHFFFLSLYGSFSEVPVLHSTYFCSSVSLFWMNSYPLCRIASFSSILVFCVVFIFMSLLSLLCYQDVLPCIPYINLYISLSLFHFSSLYLLCTSSLLYQSLSLCLSFLPFPYLCICVTFSLPCIFFLHSFTLIVCASISLIIVFSFFPFLFLWHAYIHPLHLSVSLFLFVPSFHPFSIPLLLWLACALYSFKIVSLPLFPFPSSVPSTSPVRHTSQTQKHISRLNKLLLLQRGKRGAEECLLARSE